MQYQQQQQQCLQQYQQYHSQDEGQEEEVPLDVVDHLLQRVQEGELGGPEDARKVLQPAAGRAEQRGEGKAEREGGRV